MSLHEGSVSGIGLFERVREKPSQKSLPGTDKIAAAISWSSSRASDVRRDETGRRSASYERVTAICDELGISPVRLNELLLQKKRR